MILQVHNETISIHALREEGDTASILRASSAARFLSTPSARRATAPCSQPLVHTLDFYPRPPRGGRQSIVQNIRRDHLISIHALREEGDGCPVRRYYGAAYFYPRPPRGGRQTIITAFATKEVFLSTPSARRATGDKISGFFTNANFYPRPPRGGRQIHAALTRTEGVFLSTPSARRATRARGVLRLDAGISIHALREEGDR